MAKMGRPKAEEPKKNRVTVRFDDREFDKLKECAEKNNLTITEKCWIPSRRTFNLSS